MGLTCLIKKFEYGLLQDIEGLVEQEASSSSQHALLMMEELKALIEQLIQAVSSVGQNIATMVVEQQRDRQILERIEMGITELKERLQ